MDDFKKNNKISDDELDQVSGGVKPGTFCSNCGRAISGMTVIVHGGLCPGCAAKVCDGMNGSQK